MNIHAVQLPGRRSAWVVCVLAALLPWSNIRADVIELGPESPGVRLVGKASIAPYKPRKGDSEDPSMAAAKVVNLGLWSKPALEENAVEFVPQLPGDGTYDVYVRWTNQTVRGLGANPAKFILKHEGGEQVFQFTDSSAARWVFLGSYPFKKSGQGMLRADGTGSFGTTSVFGARFQRLENPQKSLAPRPPVLPVVPGSADEFDRMRLRVAEIYSASASADMTKPEIRQVVARKSANNYLLWKAMIRQEGQVRLWGDLPIDQGKPIEKNEGGGWPLSRTFDRVTQLASAYVDSNEELGFAEKMQGNPELLKDILFALEWLYENRYNERSVNKFGAEWIGMEVSNPANIAATLLMLDPQVPKDLLEKQIRTMQKQSPGPDKFYGNFPATGFNLYNGIQAFVLRSILTKDKAAMDRIAGLLASEYQIASRANPIVRGGGAAAPGEGGDGDEAEPKPAKGEKGEKGEKGGKAAKESKGGDSGKSKSSADGYYADGSFIQHGNLPYIGIYGRGMLQRFGQIQEILKGSPWALNDPRAGIFYDMVYRGYAPLFFGGEIMYGSLGRSVGQSWHQNGMVSSEILNALVPMMAGAPPEHAGRLKSVFRTWLIDKKNAAYPEFSPLDLRKVSPDNFVTLQKLLADDSVQPERVHPGSTVFFNTDYVVHHQPDFAAHLRMFSTRIRTHEDINQGTNRFGWYQGYGTLVIYDRDNSRFNDHFWATVNPYRLPGTTVDTRPRETPGSRNGDISTSPWAGAVEWNGASFASMILGDPGCTLTAQKSWFFLDDQVVCLGTGIRSTDDRTIETIVENAKLHEKPEDYPFTVNGARQPDSLGWSADLAGVKWAHLGGKVPGTAAGWVFPKGADLKALRETRKGRWTDSFVNDANTAEHSRNFLALWQDHGKNPDGKDYAYIILPGRTTEQTKAYADKPAVEIVEHSAKAHAVRSAARGMTGVTFWEPGTVAGITASAPAAVLVADQSGKLVLSIADPTQLAPGVEISLGISVKGIEKADPALEVVSQSPLKVKANFEKTDGRSLVATFTK